MPEMPRTLLETLRQPLEDGQVTISRANLSLTFPSRFVLVGAMNPCPCGYYGDEVHGCKCGMGQILSYRQRLSGPLLDRIDMTLEVARLPVEKLARDDAVAGEGSSAVKARVMAARAKQNARNVPVSRGGVQPPPGSGDVSGRRQSEIADERQTELTDFTGDEGRTQCSSGDVPVAGEFVGTEAATPSSADVSSAAGDGGRDARPTEDQGTAAGPRGEGRLPHQIAHGCANAALTSRQVKAYCRLDDACQALLTRAVERLGLSARAYERIRKVARTIADLDGAEEIGVPHLAEAIQYRSGEERLRG